jgi:hypothetical protein
MICLAAAFALSAYAAPASAARGVAQHVTLTLDANGAGPAVSTGAINETGTFTTTSIRFAGRTAHATFTVAFSDGTYSGKYVSIIKHQSFDEATCTLTETGKGTDVINKKLGTGIYEGIKGSAGHFTYVGTAVGVATVDGCDMSAPTRSTVVEVDGKIKLPS